MKAICNACSDLLFTLNKRKRREQKVIENDRLGRKGREVNGGGVGKGKNGVRML